MGAKVSCEKVLDYERRLRKPFREDAQLIMEISFLERDIEDADARRARGRKRRLKQRLKEKTSEWKKLRSEWRDLFRSAKVEVHAQYPWEVYFLAECCRHTGTSVIVKR